MAPDRPLAGEKERKPPWSGYWRWKAVQSIEIPTDTGNTRCCEEVQDIETPTDTGNFRRCEEVQSIETTTDTGNTRSCEEGRSIENPTDTGNTLREIEIPTNTRIIKRVRKTRNRVTRRQAECQDDSPPDYPAKRTTIMDLPKELLLGTIGHVLTVETPIILRELREARWASEIANLRDIPQWSRQQRFPPGYQHAPKRKRMRKSPLLPALLVCKDFYWAGLEAYYSKNLFRFEDVKHLQRIKARLSNKHKKLLERIEVQLEWARITGVGTDPPRFETCPNLSDSGDVLEDLAGLKSVLVRCSAEVTVSMSAASRADKVKRQIMNVVEEAWPSGAEREILEFAFPDEWGRVTAK